MQLRGTPGLRAPMGAKPQQCKPAVPTLRSKIVAMSQAKPAAADGGFRADDAKVDSKVQERFVDYIKSEVPREGIEASFLANSKFSKEVGLKPKAVYRNLAPGVLYEMALRYEPGTHITSAGALATTSGQKTGRSPKDKRVVNDKETEGEIWRGAGSPNFDMDEATFKNNRETAVDFLNAVDRVYVIDAYANWDPKYRYKIRIVATRAYHALFMRNMLIVPTEEELANWGEPDFVIYNAGAFPANKYNPHSGASQTSVDVNMAAKEMIILGTQYAGEMKKGVFSVMNYLMPKRGVLSLHSGCNVGEKGDVSFFFGLSGTGKTTLSTDPKRPLIGDDEHCWSDEGVFNIEGGCYAKCIDLSPAKEPEIFKAIRFGTVLENVVFDPVNREVDYASDMLTENTRASYPIQHIENAKIPCVAGVPKNVILLTCDAFGALPPVSKLTKEQAMYHFISGYTSKVAGTEMGVTEPEATFSACYGSAFLMWHPYKYAAMLAEKMEKFGTNAWLINTGWTGGKYGVGKRMSLKGTRAILDAIHNGELEKAPVATTKYFGFQVPTQCTGVDANVLQPEKVWGNAAEYDTTLKSLAQNFQKNFKKYDDGIKYVGEATAAKILEGGPKV